MAEGFSDQLREEGNRLREHARTEGQLKVFQEAMAGFIARAGANASLVLREILFERNARYPQRLAAATQLGRMNNQNDFNMILSAFILNQIDNRLLLIKALGDFGNTAAVTALIAAYAGADWPTRLALVEALSRLPDPETLNFFSQIFNEAVPPPPDGRIDEQLQGQIADLAGTTLSKFMVL